MNNGSTTYVPDGNNNAGTGYTVGDRLTLLRGTTLPTLTVATLD
jgi:hypothetical protein